MLKIQHRVNDPATLATLPRKLGVELDLRARGKRIVVTHEPFADGPDFDAWLEAYNHRFAILNVKEEGVEIPVREKMLAQGMEAFFFLDLSFPALIKLAESGESRIALRVSCYETVESALTLAGKADWIWVDTFGGFPLDSAGYSALRQAAFKLCLVSPELTPNRELTIEKLKQLMDQQGFVMDAVCTKTPELW